MRSHGITLAQLDALASGHHDETALRELRDLERTRQLLALRLVLRAARRSPGLVGPLDPVDVPWRVLVEAQRTAPEAVTALLSRPQVGVWTGYVLRRLRGAGDQQAPMWFHLGHLHSLAAAAGIVAGVAFRLRIPIRDGIATLPGLGSTTVPGLDGWTHTTAFGDAEKFVLGTGDGESLSPVRNFRDHGGVSAIRLDDSDPYRGLEIPLPPDPLSEPAAGRWRNVLADAWRLLDRDHPHWHRELAAGLSVISPRPATFRFRPHSASLGDGFGLAIISEPHDAANLAVTMVHEFQHSKLNAITHVAPLTEHDPRPVCYAPWRDDTRPIAGLYQGVYAFIAVAEFWARHRAHAHGADLDLALFELALVRRQVTTAHEALRRHPALTDVGKRFAERIGDRLAVLWSEEVPTPVLEAAERAALDHQVGWRVTHHRPAERDVRTAVGRWSSRSTPPRPGAPRLDPNPDPPRLDDKTILTRMRLADDHRRSPDLEIHEADTTLVTGDTGQALARYRHELGTGADRAGAWSGFAVALRAGHPGPAADLAVRRPDFLRAVHHGIRHATGEIPDPGDLAGWLSTAD